MKKRSDDPRTRCAVDSVISLIGGRWKCVIMFHLMRGTLRFSELRRSLPNITQRMLTLALRELEDGGLVQRTVYAEVPPRVEYQLTALGRSMEPILLAMKAWGERYQGRLPPDPDVCLVQARPDLSPRRRGIDVSAGSADHPAR